LTTYKIYTIINTSVYHIYIRRAKGGDIYEKIYKTYFNNYEVTSIFN